MYKKILVAVDASPTARRALREAIGLARLSGAALRLLHVVDEGREILHLETSGQFEDYERALREAGEHVLSQSLSIVQASGQGAEAVIRQIMTVQQHPADEIVSEAARWQADLIVVGTHGRRGVRRLLLGSVAESVARMAEQPVLLVRAAPGGQACKPASGQESPGAPFFQ